MKVLLKNFVELSDDEKKIVWTERNKESVRQKMYNQDAIEYRTHLDWLDKLKNRQDCMYFIVYVDDKAIGVIDFTDIGIESCEIGDYAFEDFQGSGYGILLEILILRYAFEKLNLKSVHCAVLDKNSNVYEIHKEYFGFLVDEKYSVVKEINGKKAVFRGLSLSTEKWSNWNNQKLNRLIEFFKIEKIDWK